MTQEKQITPQIWVDGDACPNPIKQVLFRAGNRTKINVTFVANHYFQTPGSPFIKLIEVPKGFDVADNEIVKRCQACDLIITNDIPLADQIVTKGAQALSTRGELFTHENIKGRLNTRDFLETLRSSGIQTTGPDAMSNREVQAFANKLDQWLNKHKKKLQ